MDSYELGKIAPLPDAVSVVPGTDVDALWEPFRFFEAGHHLMDIMNPMNEGQLDEVVEHLAVTSTDRVLDIACGHGDFLMRMVAAQPASVCGVDLSPWTIRRAETRLSNQSANANDGPTVELWHGDGRAFLEHRPDEQWDVVSLIGAPWVWGGFVPSVAALAPHLKNGGRLVIADVVAIEPEARQRLDPLYDNPATVEERHEEITAAGLVISAEIATKPEDWRAYDDRVLQGHHAWLETFPDEQAFLDNQLSYEQRRHQPDDAGWHIWILTKSEA